jgi:hypothetical protein
MANKIKIWRNKNCPNCPKNSREDIVWRKGLQDGIELALHDYRYIKLFWRFCWRKYG